MKKKALIPIKDKEKVKELLNVLDKRIESNNGLKKYQYERDKIIIIIALNTPLRIDRILKLKVIDIKNGYISIKNNRYNMPPIKLDNEIKEEIEKYVQQYREHEHAFLFDSQIKGYTHIRKRDFQKRFKEYLKEIDLSLEDGFSCESLRKTFGYMYLQKGGKVFTLKKMYGFKRGESVLIYLDI